MMDNKSQGIRKQELAGVGYIVDRGIVWFTLVWNLLQVEFASEASRVYCVPSIEIIIVS